MLSIKGKYKGKTCFIVGKGQSLNHTPESIFTNQYGVCPIITINESVEKIEAMNIPNPIYSLQQDGADWAMRRPKRATLLVSELHDSINYYKDYSPRLIYNQSMHFGIRPRIFSAITAIELAKWMGCPNIIFVGFDSILYGDNSYYDKSYKFLKDRDQRFNLQKDITLLSIGLEVNALFYDYTTNKVCPLRIGDFTVLTCTRNRPYPFSLCRKYLMRSTVLPAKWIVVSDGEKLKWEQYGGSHYIHRIGYEDENVHTLPYNMLEAIPHIKTKYTIIMEDDDWYAPTHLETVLNLLTRTGADFVGEADSIYYRLDVPGFKELRNDSHAGMWTMGFSNQTMIFYLTNICRNSLEKQVNWKIDLDLWNMSHLKKIMYNQNTTLGIKGLPGFKGMTMGWSESTKHKFTEDLNGSFLKQRIGTDDFDNYRPYLKGGA